VTLESVLLVLLCVECFIDPAGFLPLPRGDAYWGSPDADLLSLARQKLASQYCPNVRLTPNVRIIAPLLELEVHGRGVLRADFIEGRDSVRDDHGFSPEPRGQAEREAGPRGHP